MDALPKCRGSLGSRGAGGFTSQPALRRIASCSSRGATAPQETLTCGSSILTSTGGHARCPSASASARPIRAPRSRPGRLHLSAPGQRRLRSYQLGRMVRSRQAARAYGRARPSGRRGVLDRAVLGVLLRPAGRGRARRRHPLERGDGGRAEEISRPALGERRGAAGRHPDRASRCSTTPSTGSV